MTSRQERGREERGPWYLLTGLIIGLLLGALYARFIQPVEYVDTSPASLRADFKDRQRALIAAAYAATGDLVRAQARLGLLQDADVFRALTEQAQRTLAENGSGEEARSLGLLAIALGQAPPGPALAYTLPPASPTLFTPPAMETALPADTEEPPTPFPTVTLLSAGEPSETPAPLETATLAPEVAAPTPSETLPPTPTSAPLPARSATPIPGAPFALVRIEKLCDQRLDRPLVQIEAQTAAGKPAPGIPVIVTSASGEERFFTGLKPEIGPGYADFSPAPGVVYTLRVGEDGQPLPDLTAAQCQDANNQTYWGAWLLVFAQPQ